MEEQEGKEGKEGVATLPSQPQIGKGQSNKRAARNIKSERAIWLTAEKADSTSERKRERERERDCS